MKNPVIKILLLAAGASRRMQQAKQLIRIGEQTLMERAIDQALKSEIGPVMVVYGAHKERVLPLLKKWPVDIVNNPDWNDGLGKSISTGISALLGENPPEHILIVLADQPLIEAKLLKDLTKLHLKTGKLITACQYGKTIGVPAIFSASTFDHLEKLKGDKGAKAIMKRYKAIGQLGLFKAPAASIDLDTPEDLSKFLG